MLRPAPCVFLVVLFAAAAEAQSPAIRLHGVVNAASFAAPGLPNGSIAQGSLFTIFGSALGPDPGVSASKFPLGTALAGVSISISQGSTQVAAIPVFVGAGQINALMPSNAPLGWVSLRVLHNNAGSNYSPVFVVHDSPGVFSFTGTGLGPSALQNYLSATNTPVNSLQAAANPGQTEILYVTGLGPISSPDADAPPVGNLATPVEVWVGGVPATVTYSGRSPCCSGLDQIDFVVPNSAPQGCWVPVSVRTNHATVSNFVSMAIGAKGSACSDSSNAAAASVAHGGSLGQLTLTRMAIHEDVGVNAPIDVTDDFLGFTATQQIGGEFAFAPFVSLPPPGSCTVYPGVGDFFETTNVPQASTVSAQLDAGTQFQVNAEAKQVSVPLIGTGGPIGSFLPLYSLPNTLFLSPGDYTVKSSGGAKVASFQATITMPAPLVWTNRDETTNVPRNQPLTLNWSGGGSGQTVVILGADSDLPTNSSAVFICNSGSGANSFTVPPEVLSAIPATRPDVLRSKSAIYVIGNVDTPFSAPGLQTAISSAVYATGKTVVFQ
ncbi:MAG TPA: hypothetical protein VFW44_06695 [Bryobacteraceae bacterium]|nr:hypothetical protein [Bryobacteraceae bacterium]